VAAAAWSGRVVDVFSRTKCSDARSLRLGRLARLRRDRSPCLCSLIAARTPLSQENSADAWKPLPHKPGWRRRQGGLRGKAHRSLYLHLPAERPPRLAARTRPKTRPPSPLSMARSRLGVTPLPTCPPREGQASLQKPTQLRLKAAPAAFFRIEPTAPRQGLPYSRPLQVVRA
jgi:hypothetical protein